MLWVEIRLNFLYLVAFTILERDLQKYEHKKEQIGGSGTNSQSDTSKNRNVAACNGLKHQTEKFGSFLGITNMYKAYVYYRHVDTHHSK